MFYTLRCHAVVTIVTIACISFANLAAAFSETTNCQCPLALPIDYNQDRIPDALRDAYSTIELKQQTWEIAFTVHNILPLLNGHVVAGHLDTHATSQQAFSPYVARFNTSELWATDNCSVAGINQPAPSLGITVQRYLNCTRSFSMTFSLINGSKQNPHCNLNTANPSLLVVNCDIILSSVRAYDLSEPAAFLSAETTFSGIMNIPRNVGSEVSSLMWGTMAKCNVLNGPEFAIDCRLVGQWDFNNEFTVSQNIPWVDETSCVQSQTAAATFGRCQLLDVPIGFHSIAVANISARETIRGQDMKFSIVYTLPRATSYSISASLSRYIETIGLSSERFYYAGGDLATVSIRAADTSLLQMTSILLVNQLGQSYNLRNFPQFQLQENINSTHFSLTFRPAGFRQDVGFYRAGPHAINVSFSFSTAQARRQGPGLQTGYVYMEGIRVKPDPALSPGADAAGGVSGAAVFLVVIVFGGVIVYGVRRYRQQQQQDLSSERTVNDDADIEKSSTKQKGGSSRTPQPAVGGEPVVEDKQSLFSKEDGQGNSANPEHVV